MRKNIILTVFIIFISVLLCFTDSEQLNLMPIPKKISIGQGKIILTTGFVKEIKGPYSERVENGVKELFKIISDKTGNDFNNLKPDYNFKISYKKRIKLSPIMNESYTLNIDKNGIILSANTDVGIIRGFQTLVQLLKQDAEGYYFPFVKIKDKPRFAWRGLLIDVSRHFIPIEVLKRNIRALAFLKMNVLHLHLTDDQGFRIECNTFPKLHLLASDGQYYTKKQMKEIIKFADIRGIRIVPEFDMPGHTASWLVAYPKLASLKKKYKMIRSYGVKDPVMDPSDKYVYKFLKKFFKEMSKLFPDKYIHIGGDEVNGVQWKKSEKIKKFMKKHRIDNFEDLQQYFNKKIFKILKKYKKSVIGWDEIYKNGMDKDVVIQSWRGKKTLYKTAKNGYFSILSNGYYIDLSKPAYVHYNNDPIPENSGLKKEEKKKILGGEATMWAELVSPENIDSRIWTRTAAIAERFWSPQRVKSVDYLYKRLKVISIILEEFGLSHIKNSDMMLRRIKGDKDIKTLKILHDVVAPLKNYKRHSSKEYTIFTPLTRFVDAAFPDCKIPRNFDKLVDKYLLFSDKDSEEKILHYLKIWKNNHKRLKKIIDKTPVLKEIEMLSSNLSEISELAIEAIKARKEGKILNDEFKNKAEKIIEESKKSYGELTIEVVRPIEKLITREYKDEICSINTKLGEMKFVFYNKDAPLTVLNFKRLIKDGFYKGKPFYRVVKGHVIQAGDGGENNWSTVQAEFNKNPHIIGAVGLARDVDPNSGSTEFYICVAPRSYLDGKYTVFGQLISGFDVLQKIENVKVKKIYLGKDKKIAFHTPVEPVLIKSIKLELVSKKESDKKLKDVLKKYRYK